MASIGIFREEGIVENAAAMGGVLATELAALAERHPSVGEVRGLGLFWGLEMVRDRATREPLVPFNAGGEAAAPMARLGKAAMERGLFMMTHFNMIVICSIMITLFFGGWHGPFMAAAGPVFGPLLGLGWFLLKLAAFLFFFIWVRWTFPRLRYDQLMNFGWKVLLPAAIANVLIAAVWLYWRANA